MKDNWFLCIELKNQVEIPENEAKERHQKLWEGMLLKYIHHR